MSESPEKPSGHFKHPDIYAESGEFDRVATELGVESSVLQYQAQNGKMVPLNIELWNSLENIDSKDIDLNDWDKIEELSSQVNRDWKGIKNKLETGVVLDAPIIVKYGDRYHKVSGNTRLMVEKALGITPQIFLFEIDLNH